MSTKENIVEDQNIRQKCNSCRCWYLKSDFTVPHDSNFKTKTEFKSCVKCRKYMLEHRKKKGKDIRETCECGVTHTISRKQKHLESKTHLFHMLLKKEKERVDMNRVQGEIVQTPIVV